MLLTFIDIILFGMRAMLLGGIESVKDGAFLGEAVYRCFTEGAVFL